MTKTEKLEKILEIYNINFDDLSNLNECQIKAIEVDYFNRYGENISITFSSNKREKRTKERK